MSDITVCVFHPCMQSLRPWRTAAAAWTDCVALSPWLHVQMFGAAASAGPGVPRSVRSSQEAACRKLLPSWVAFQVPQPLTWLHKQDFDRAGHAKFVV